MMELDLSQVIHTAIFALIFLAMLAMLRVLAIYRQQNVDSHDTALAVQRLRAEYKERLAEQARQREQMRQ